MNATIPPNISIIISNGVSRKYPYSSVDISPAPTSNTSHNTPIIITDNIIIKKFWSFSLNSHLYI